MVRAPLCRNLPDVPAQLLSLLASSIIKTFSPYLALKLQYNVHTPLCHLPRSLKGQRTRQGFYHKQTGVLAPRRYGQRLQESPGRSLHLFYFVLSLSCDFNCKPICCFWKNKQQLLHIKLPLTPLLRNKMFILMG